MKKTETKQTTVPCEECISLAVCVASKELDCTILLGFLNKAYPESVYPEWPKLSAHLCKVLRGTWCIVALNNNIYKVQKNRTIEDSRFF